MQTVIKHEKRFLCSLQLVVDAVIPEQFGGVGGEAIYIGQKVTLLTM